MRIGLLAVVLLAVVAGGAWAAAAPKADKTPSFAEASGEPEALTADKLARVVDRLAERGIDAEGLADLAATYGLGGAIRLLAWAESTGKSIAELTAMRDDGQGWGQMARELGVGAGIGWIMGNGHSGDHGKANAPGQLKDKGPDAAESPAE